MSKGSTHENLQRNHGFKVATPQRFGLNMSGLFFVFTAYLFLTGSGLWSGAFVVALLFLLAAIFIPFALAPINAFWTGLGLFLARFTNPIILAVIYIIVITPIALIYRIFSKETFRKKLTNSQSTWENRSPGSDLTRQF